MCSKVCIVIRSASRESTVTAAGVVTVVRIVIVAVPFRTPTVVQIGHTVVMDRASRSLLREENIHYYRSLTKTSISLPSLVVSYHIPYHSIRLPYCINRQHRSYLVLPYDSYSIRLTFLPLVE